MDAPRTRARLAADLDALGVRRGETLLLHSSLSSLGWVCGGQVAVVEAFLDVLGGTGTLVVPTHSGGNSDPSTWVNPPVPAAWWPVIRETMPAFDPHVTPGLGTGAVSEAVRTWPGALRSTHPAQSFAALGPGAARIVDGHAPDSAFGENSPLARLEDAGARLLLLGVGWEACTTFHLAEYRLPEPRTRRVSFAMATPEGRRWATYTDVAADAGDFGAIGAALESAASGTGAVVRGHVGSAPCRLADVRGAVAFAQDWMTRHRGFPDTPA